MTSADLRVHIRQLCCLGLPGEQLMPKLLKAVRQLVDADSAGFFWVDSHGDLTSFYAERLLPAPVMKLYFERYFESGESAFRRVFTERIRAAEPVIAVSPTPASERTPLYNEVFRHLNAHHVLYGVVREQAQAIGQLSLYRPKSAQAFSTTQRTQLASVMRYVAHGLSRRPKQGNEAGDYSDTEDESIFLIGADGRLAELSSASRRLLALAVQGAIGPASSVEKLGVAARPALRCLLERLRMALTGEEGEPPSLMVENAWGRFALRAYSLAEAPSDHCSKIAISIKRQEPFVLKFVDALNGFALSPQQREVAVGLAKGASNQELADSLGITINTVGYHVKQLFQKLDAHDRPEMMAKVLRNGG